MGHVLFDGRVVVAVVSTVTILVAAMRMPYCQYGRRPELHRWILAGVLGLWCAMLL